MVPASLFIAIFLRWLSFEIKRRGILICASAKIYFMSKRAEGKDADGLKTVAIGLFKAAFNFKKNQKSKHKNHD